MLKKDSINRKHLLLGLLLNILVIIVFLLIYHAYIISPRLRTETPQAGEMILPEGNNLPQ
jgi:heme A synthase